MSSLGNREIFARNLSHYIEKSGRTQKEISEIVGVSTSTFNDWVKGKKYPRIDKIEMLAEYFGILKSDLIEEKLTEEKEKDNDTLANIIVRMRTDEKYSSVVESIYDLEPSKLDAISQMIETLKAFGK